MREEWKCIMLVSGVQCMCDDGWRCSAAQVVCSELGFSPAISVRYKAFYGQGSGQIWLGNVIYVGRMGSS